MCFFRTGLLTFPCHPDSFCKKHILHTLSGTPYPEIKKSGAGIATRPPLRCILMSYQPIENYGLIGNMRTAALVGTNGSIDWFCFPHFDSPSIFAAILDDQIGGRFQISPVADQTGKKQF